MSDLIFTLEIPTESVKLKHLKPQLTQHATLSLNYLHNSVLPTRQLARNCKLKLIPIVRRAAIVLVARRINSPPQHTTCH